jgi:hypothetical protein
MLRKVLLMTALAALPMIPALPAAAQSLSAADILAKVESKVGGVNEYQALLNDPDPARSMAAMEVMLESGDPKLLRMALDFGLYSPNPVVQRMALDGFFGSEPILSIFFSGAEAQKEKRFGPTIKDFLKGSVDSNGVGYSAISAGKFVPEKKCYVYARDERECLASVSDSGTALIILGQVSYLKLNDSGELIGDLKLKDVEAPVTIRIPVSK